MSDNPSAFPSGDKAHFPTSTFEAGMDLRDWFAGQALIGIMSTAGAFQRADRRADMVAGKAYEFADAMLTERAKAGEA